MRRVAFALLLLVVAACSGTPPRSDTGSVVPGSIGAIVDATAAGVRVRELDPDGPAARAGLRAGDLITRCDDEPVTTTTRGSR